MEAGRLARARRPGDVEAGGGAAQGPLLQEGADGGALRVPGQQALRDGRVQRLLHRLVPGLWGENGEGG